MGENRYLLQEIVRFLDDRAVDAETLDELKIAVYMWCQDYTTRHLKPVADYPKKYIEGMEDTLWAVTGDWTGGV